MAGCLFGTKEFNDHHFDATFPPKHAADHYAIAGTNAKSDIKLRRGNAQPIDPLRWNEFWWKYNTSCNPFISVRELMDRIMRTNYSRDQVCEDGLKRMELAAEGDEMKVERKKLNQEQQKQQQWSKPALPPTLQRVSVRSTIQVPSPGHKRGVKLECYAAELLGPQREALAQAAGSVTPHGSLQEPPATPAAAPHHEPAEQAAPGVVPVQRSSNLNLKEPCSDELSTAEHEAEVLSKTAS